jgi:hypothetical protein
MWDLPTLLRWMERASGAIAAARWLAGTASPTTGLSVWLAPLAAVASVLSLALLAGLAVGALTTLLVLLLALSYVLTEVLGFSIEWNEPAFAEMRF